MLSLNPKPDLIVHGGDLPSTAVALRDLFAATVYLFDRDMPVRLVQPADGGPIMASPLTASAVVMETHRLCRPVKLDSEGQPIPVTLPERVAKMYLDMRGEWNLPPLSGIATTPLFSACGDVRHVTGYDRGTGLWCSKVPPLVLPERPRHKDALAALRLLREAFKTFPFADATRRHDQALGVEVVDLNQPPGRDESALLVALITSPSWWRRHQSCFSIT